MFNKDEYLLERADHWRQLDDDDERLERDRYAPALRPTEHDHEPELAAADQLDYEGTVVALRALAGRLVNVWMNSDIERHVDHYQLGVLQKTEGEERRLLLEMAATFNEGSS